MLDYLPFWFIILLIAAVTGEPAILTLFYLLAGATIIGEVWSRRALRGIRYHRAFPQRAFLHETVPVHLEIVNSSWLPVIWLRVQDNAPIELAQPDFFRHAVSLGSYARLQFDYQLHASKRGYYPLGPLRFLSGDLLGLTPDEQNWESAMEHLIVYPKIVQLTRVPIPSRSPLGTLRHTQPIFEDPSRVWSKRDYVAGDSLRRIDWKTSASLGRLQVKQFEPSIAVETMFFLNLNSADYAYRTRANDAELAIVVAASVANWIIGQRQAVGLSTNGADPLRSDQQVQTLMPHKGRAHLMRLLEVLARIKISKEAQPLAHLVEQESVRLPWGTTLILITSHIDAALFDAIFRSQCAGLNVLVILVGFRAQTEDTRRARHLGIPVFHIQTERDMEIWQQ